MFCVCYVVDVVYDVLMLWVVSQDSVYVDVSCKSVVIDV